MCNKHTDYNLQTTVLSGSFKTNLYSNMHFGKVTASGNFHHSLSNGHVVKASGSCNFSKMHIGV